MLCPFCLADVRFKREKLAGNPASIYLCPNCNEQAPALYAQDYRKSLNRRTQSPATPKVRLENQCPQKGDFITLFPWTKTP